MGATALSAAAASALLAARAFFGQPPAAKRVFAKSAGKNRGYIPDVAKTARRESFKSGGPQSSVPTPWPSDELRKSWDAFYTGAEHLCRSLLHALAEALGREAREAEDLHTGHISVMEAARYSCEPPGSGGPAGPDVVCGEHRDLGTLTLIAADRPGLQFYDAGAEVWREAGDGTGHGGLMVVAGDMLSRWSAGQLRACRHRVLRRGDGRLSLMFFHQPRGPCVVSPPGVLPLMTAEESRSASVQQPFHAEYFDEPYARF